MKRHTASILSLCLSLQACTSFFEVADTEPDLGLGRSDRDIHIVLEDGTAIQAEEHTYVLVNEPSNFYYGSGKIFNMKGISARERNIGVFRGRVDPIRVTTRVDTTSDIPTGWRYLWISDSTAIRFDERKYVQVTPERGVGLYIAGHDDVLSQDDIRRVEERRIDWLLTSIVYGIPVASFIAARIYCQKGNCIGFSGR